MMKPLLRWKATFFEWIKYPNRIGLWSRFNGAILPLVVLVLGIASVCILIWVPEWQVARIRPRVTGDQAFALENEARRTITQIILGVFGLLVLYFTWRRVRAADKTVEVAEQGHVTERFTKAIEQLGKTENGEPNIEVRLGAIYALERIAIDSPRDQSSIVEILCAYVRRNTAEARAGSCPSIDVQATLTVLGRRRIGEDRESPGMRIDLRGTRLFGANLIGANFSGADLWGAVLNEANLSGANLEGADLTMATLRSSILNQANLRNAKLTHADFEGATLAEAHLEDAVLIGAKIPKANLQRASLDRANLHAANLTRSNLTEAQLVGAMATAADFQGAILVEANLEKASLKDAQFTGAFLGSARFVGASGLTPSQVREAVGWDGAHYSPAFASSLQDPT